jgi:hypothetical protein
MTFSGLISRLAPHPGCFSGAGKSNGLRLRQPISILDWPLTRRYDSPSPAQQLGWNDWPLGIERPSTFRWNKSPIMGIGSL